MRSGKLRHVIKIQQATHGVNEYRTATTTWADLYTLRAAIIEEAASETVTDAGAEDLAVIRFHTRFAPITAAMRLVFNSENFNIKRVRPMRNDREMEIEAQKIGGVDEGA